jgi:hypothetical protein
MKAMPPALRNGLLRMRREGASFATISKAFGVPKGTVKSVCSKEGVKKTMEPLIQKGENPLIEPQKLGVHRGLRVEDMPGRTGWERRSTFALFKRGEWPPLHWHIPAVLEGGDLRARLLERAAMYQPKRKA